MEKIEWSEVQSSIGNKTGQVKVKCPSCINRRSNKGDRSLSVNVAKGVAKCHYCEAISIREEEEKKEYTLPPQEWRNHTEFSDGFVKFAEKRRISQKTLQEIEEAKSKI